MIMHQGALHLRAQSYDILQRGGVNDILSVEGWFVAVRDCMRLARHGLLWGGIPCSTCLSYIIVTSGCLTFIA